MSIAGYEILMTDKASLGFEPYRTYWRMIQANKEEFNAADLDEAVEKLMLPGYFLYTSELPFHYSQPPQLLKEKGIDLRFVRDPKPNEEAILLTKDSPFQKMFLYGTNLIKVWFIKVADMNIPYTIFISTMTHILKRE